MEQKKKIIGITGGVGAGKSSVLAVLRENFGAKIILADLVAHDLMEPGREGLKKVTEALGSEGLKKVTEALGTSFLAPDGSVDRKALADVIFRNKDALRTMNSIIHPLVWKTMKEAAEAAEEHLVIIEAAVFDTAPKDLFDELWYVYTTKENRITRLMANRGYSREKCEDIIGRQASEEEYRALCDRVIDNNGDESDIKRQLKEILDHEIC